MSLAALLKEIILLFVQACMLAGCYSTEQQIIGSGECVSVKKSISGFSSVSISSGCKAEISRADSFSVIIITDDNIHPYVETWKDGNTLNVQFEATNSYMPTDFKAIISCPDLITVSASNSTDIVFKDIFVKENCLIQLSDMSLLTGNINGKNLTLNLSAGSKSDITGCFDSLTIYATGNSRCLVPFLNVNNCYVTMSGSSEADISAAGVISGLLSSVSKLYYSGNPLSVTVTTSGEATVIKR